MSGSGLRTVIRTVTQTHPVTPLPGSQGFAIDAYYVAAHGTITLSGSDLLPAQAPGLTANTSISGFEWFENVSDGAVSGASRYQCS